MGIETQQARAAWHLIRQVLSASPPGLVGPEQTKTLAALRDVNLDVSPGEVLGIIGRNGAGKSTLLKILARVLAPSAGIVRIKGRVVSMLELGIGFVPDLTLRENIAIYGRLAGMGAREVARAEDQILAFAELTAYRDTKLEACPSGSFMRIAFSTLINLRAEVILADEVLAVGDAEYRQTCEQRIRGAAISGETVLFVSHDMNAIKRICTRVVWIDHGQIRMIGETDEVVSVYQRELLIGHLTDHEALPEKACGIIDFRLLDEDRAPVGALHLHAPAYIDCVFRLYRPDAFVNVAFELWQNKTLVFSAVSPRRFSSKSPVTYRVGIHLPAHFLNEKSYTARCKLLAHNLQDVLQPAVVADSQTMDFQVFNANPELSVWSDWQWGRGGAVAPRLHWTQSILNDAHAEGLST